jgi:hypothetical protein
MDVKPVPNSYHTQVGNEAEYAILNILNAMGIRSWKDSYNSQFDIFFSVKEGIVQGLQVKAITRVSGTTDNFRMNHLDKYPRGFLIVGVNVETGLGLCYIVETDSEPSTARISLSKNSTGRFSKLVRTSQQFLADLTQLLPKAPVASEETIKKSMSSEYLKEYESTFRFMEACRVRGLIVTKIEDTSSVTDLLVNGVKVQLKYSEAISSEKNGTHGFKISLAKSGKATGKAKQPYQVGDNGIYIIEVGSNKGEFLCLLEDRLVGRGYIGTSSQPGKTNLDVYPYDYVEKRLALGKSKYGPALRGNWTSDKSLWILRPK